jgi:hypothetical protein
VPRVTGARIATAASGLYAWLADRLEADHARGDPRSPGQVPPVPEILRRARAGQPLTMPAWMLDGHHARAAGLAGAIPVDRSIRAAAYVITSDGTVRPAPLSR